MKTFTSCLLLVALAVFCQAADNNRMSPAASDQAWVAIGTAPDNLPPIVGGWMVAEKGPNMGGKELWARFSESGVYLLQGKVCNSKKVVEIAEIWWEKNSSFPVPPGATTAFGGVVFDSRSIVAGAPYHPSNHSIYEIEAVRQDSTNTAKEKLVVEIFPCGTPAPKPQFAGEGLMPDGRYYVSISGPIAKDATVILGRTLVGEVLTTPAGTIVVFPDMWLPLGPTTLTVCAGTRCSSSTFEHKLEIPGGKG